MKKSTITAIVITLVVLIGAAIIIFKPSKTNTPSSSSNDDHSSNSNSNASDDNASAAVTVTYNGSGFSLSSDTIKSGQTLKVTNNSDDELDFDSNPHPTHTDNPELNVGNIDPHHSKTVTLKATGKWGFHNHHNPDQHGFITVE